jgi:ABC-type multidrug transport system permease subunit
MTSEKVKFWILIYFFINISYCAGILFGFILLELGVDNGINVIIWIIILLCFGLLLENSKMVKTYLKQNKEKKKV